MALLQLATTILLVMALGLPFVLSQNPLRIAGIESFDEEDLLEYLEEKGLETGQLAFWKERDRERATRLLIQYYKDRGYPFIRVAWNPPLGNSLRVRENPRIRLDRILWEGNLSFPEKELEEFLPVGKWFHQGEVTEGLEQIRRFYRDQGFVRAEVFEGRLTVHEVSVSDHFPLPFSEKTSLAGYLRVKVGEGQRYRFGKTRLTADLHQAVSVPVPGEFFSERRLFEFREDIVRHFLEEGHLLKDLQIYQHIDDSRKRVNIRVEAEPYPPLVVRRITLVGNRRYPDSFYRRELRVQEQEVLTPLQLQTSLESLARTGVLTSIQPSDVEIQVDRKYLQADVKITLHERKPQSISYSVGPDGLGGLQASVFYSLLNLLNLGEVLGIEMTAGDQVSGFAVQLASRYLFGTDLPLSLLLGFAKRHADFDLPGLDEEIRRLLGEDRTTMSASLAYRVTEKRQLGLNLAHTRLSSSQKPLRQWVLEPFWSHDFTSGTQPDNLHLSNRFSLFTTSLESWNHRPSLRLQKTFSDQSAGSSFFQLDVKGAYAFFAGGQPPLTERLFFDETDLRGFSGFTSVPWAQRQGGLFPAGAAGSFVVKLDHRIPLNDVFAVSTFTDIGWSGSPADPAGLDLVEETRSVWRTSLGSEFRVGGIENLPTARLIFAWNPLRLNGSLLKDPPLRFKLALEP